MHKLGLSGHKKLSEEERRKQWGKNLTTVAVVSMVVFIFILLIGVFATDGRACVEREALQGATCQPCVDKHCGDCTGDHTKCVGDGTKSSCYEGFWRRDDGICIDCDIATSDDPDASDILDKKSITCQKCANKTPEDTKPVCTKC